jgi:2-haloacid dehalogenase
MIDFEPKFGTFDCYGTLTAFGMSAVTRQLLADRVPGERMEDSLDDFEAHRLDEAIGPFKPYDQLINDALRRTAVKWGIEHRDSDARTSTRLCRPGVPTPTFPRH